MESQPKALDIKRNMLYNTVGSLMYQGCLWITTVLVVILANGYSDSGILSFAMTIGNMFNAVGTYNMRTYQVSDIKGKYSQQNYVGFRILTIAIGLVLLDTYSLLVSPDSQTLIAVFAYLLFKTDESFCDVLYGVDQRSERMDYIGISQFLRGIVVVAAFSCSLYMTKDIVVAYLPCILYACLSRSSMTFLMRVSAPRSSPSFFPSRERPFWLNACRLSLKSSF